MSYKIQKFVNDVTRPGFDLVKGENRKGLSKAIGWFKTLAANIFTLGTLYIVARKIDFKAKPSLKSNRVEFSEEFRIARAEIEKLPQENDSCIGFYKGGVTEVFGNFAPCQVTYKGFQFGSVEAAYQAAKWIILLEEKEDLSEETKATIQAKIKEIQEAKDADSALRISRSLEKTYPNFYPQNWKQGVRDQVMWGLLCQKFQKEPYKSCLLATGNAFLIEHRPSRGADNYWSDGHDGRGGNRLGDMLHQLRSLVVEGKALPEDAPDSNVENEAFKTRTLQSARYLNRAILNNTLGYAPYGEKRSFAKFLFVKPVTPSRVECLKRELLEVKRSIAKLKDDGEKAKAAQKMIFKLAENYDFRQLEGTSVSQLNQFMQGKLNDEELSAILIEYGNKLKKT